MSDEMGKYTPEEANGKPIQKEFQTYEDMRESLNDDELKLFLEQKDLKRLQMVDAIILFYKKAGADKKAADIEHLRVQQGEKTLEGLLAFEMGSQNDHGELGVTDTHFFDDVVKDNEKLKYMWDLGDWEAINPDQQREVIGFHNTMSFSIAEIAERGVKARISHASLREKDDFDFQQVGYKDIAATEDVIYEEADHYTDFIINIPGFDLRGRLQKDGPTRDEMLRFLDDLRTYFSQVKNQETINQLG